MDAVCQGRGLMDELKGIKEVKDRIDSLPAGLRERLIYAMGYGLEMVQNEAKDNHPPWPDKISNPDGTWRYHNITQNLTNSIGLRIMDKGDIIEGDMGILNETVKANAMEYAGKIERDHPFIVPAVEAKKKEWLEIIAKEARKFFV